MKEEMVSPDCSVRKCLPGVKTQKVERPRGLKGHVC